MSELKSIAGPDPDARRNAVFNCMLGDGRITAGICLHDWNALENECVGQNEERGDGHRISEHTQWKDRATHCSFKMEK